MPVQDSFNSFTVLLGFSFDGNYCLFYSCDGSSVSLFWTLFPPLQFETVVVAQRVHLFPQLSLERQDLVTLSVAQSRDLAIVASIGAKAQMKNYHITLTTSPFAGTCSNSLHLIVEIDGHSNPLQHPDHLVLQSSNDYSYMAVINSIHSIHVIYYYLKRENPLAVDEQPSVPCWNQTPSIAIVSKVSNPMSSQTLEYTRQRTFEVEEFISSIKHTLHVKSSSRVVDYETHIVDTVDDRLLIALLIVKLTNDIGIMYQRRAVLFELNLLTGRTRVIQMAKCRDAPVEDDQLNQKMVHSVKQKYQKLSHDLQQRTWNNHGIIHTGQSLSTLYNSRFPYQITLDRTTRSP